MSLTSLMDRLSEYHLADLFCDQERGVSIYPDVKASFVDYLKDMAGEYGLSNEELVMLLQDTASDLRAKAMLPSHQANQRALKETFNYPGLMAANE